MWHRDAAWSAGPVTRLTARDRYGMMVEGAPNAEGMAGMGAPPTRYARAGDVNIAYQVLGDGPVDLLWVGGLCSNLDVLWEEPAWAAFMRRLARSCRLVVFDRRGTGISDRGGATTTPTLEERLEDMVAVLDAVGSDRKSVV